MSLIQQMASGRQLLLAIKIIRRDLLNFATGFCVGSDLLVLMPQLDRSAIAGTR